MGIDEDKGKTDGCAAVHVDRYICNVVRKLDLEVCTNQAILEEVVDLRILQVNRLVYIRQAARAEDLDSHVCISHSLRSSTSGRKDITWEQTGEKRDDRKRKLATHALLYLFICHGALLVRDDGNTIFIVFQVNMPL